MSELSEKEKRRIRKDIRRMIEIVEDNRHLQKMLFGKPLDLRAPAGFHCEKVTVLPGRCKSKRKWRGEWLQCEDLEGHEACHYHLNVIWHNTDDDKAVAHG